MCFKESFYWRAKMFVLTLPFVHFKKYFRMFSPFFFQCYKLGHQNTASTCCCSSPPGQSFHPTVVTNAGNTCFSMTSPVNLPEIISAFSLEQKRLCWKSNCIIKKKNRGKTSARLISASPIKVTAGWRRSCVYEVGLTFLKQTYLWLCPVYLRVFV